jgi:hypothetical protein
MTGATSALTAIATVASTVKTVQDLTAKKPKALAPVQPAQAAPFKPEKPAPVARPIGLSEYSSFTPEQERSSLATKGLNQGLGKDENAYYKNLVQRSLIGDDNTPAPDTNSLLPVESQYFSRQGMNTSGIMDFLKQLQGAS